MNYFKLEHICELRIAIVIILSVSLSLNSLTQISCGDVAASAAQIEIEAPNFDIEVINTQYSLGTCGTIEYNGKEINGNSSFDFKVNLALGADEVVCGVIDNEVPNPINESGTYSCEFNIVNITGAISAYSVTAITEPILALEKIIKGTVNRTDIVQVYSPVETMVELPLVVSATLGAVQSFCYPGIALAKAETKLTASFGGASASIAKTATISGSLFDFQYPAESQVLRKFIPAGVSTHELNLAGELSVSSKVLAVSPVIVCGSNAFATAGNVSVGNFRGANGIPLPEGMTIVGLESGINYINPVEPLSCVNIAAPEIVVENDNCGSSIGSATVSAIDTLSYEWSNGATGELASDLSYGTYFLNVRDEYDCSRDFPVLIDDPEAPEITLPAFITIEENELIRLIPTDTTDTTLSYLWSTGETTPSIQVSTEGAYSVTITTASSCVYEAETLVQEDTPIDFSPCMAANYLFSTNADDISGHDNHATVFGATLTEDRHGRSESAYYFDGIDDYIEIPAVAETQPEAGLSFTAWFKSDNLPGGNGGTIVKNTGLGYELALSEFSAGNISSSIHLQSGSNLELNSRYNKYADNDWHSLAITYDNNTGIYRLFIDGNLDGESFGSMDAIAYQMGTPFLIGKDGVSNSNYFKGSIDDVKIFNCALNDDELSYLFAQQQDFNCFTEIYFEDFEGVIGSEWSSSITHEIIHPITDTVKFLGRFNNHTITLTLPNMPVNYLVTVCFDLWILDSWDGNTTGSAGPDIFSLNLLSDRSLLRTTFSNWENLHSQSFPSDYSIDNNAINHYGTGALISEDLNDQWTFHHDAGIGIDAKYRIHRTFINVDDTLMINFKSADLQSLSDESWGIDNVSVLVEPKILNVEDETVTCNSDGSYLVSIPFTPNSDNINYMAFEQSNTFGEIDTLFFTDDGTISSIEMGPYPLDRDYNIIIATSDDNSNCYPVISGTTQCTFNQPCNLNATFNNECDGDSLIISATISGGIGPYSISSDIYSSVLFPDEGNTFEFSIPDCSAQSIEFTITDFSLCEYTANVDVGIDLIFECDSSLDTDVDICLDHKSISHFKKPISGEFRIKGSFEYYNILISSESGTARQTLNPSVDYMVIQLSPVFDNSYFISFQHKDLDDVCLKIHLNDQ